VINVTCQKQCVINGAPNNRRGTCSQRQTKESKGGGGGGEEGWPDEFAVGEISDRPMGSRPGSRLLSPAAVSCSNRRSRTLRGRGTRRRQAGVLSTASTQFRRLDSLPLCLAASMLPFHTRARHLDDTAPSSPQPDKSRCCAAGCSNTWQLATLSLPPKSSMECPPTHSVVINQRG
jgi:hypothetical protein